MTRLMEQARQYTRGTQHTEGGLAKPIEEVTAALPSDTFLWLGWGSLAVAAALRMMGRTHDALLVSVLGPVFLIHGVYNKIVKVAGHDKYDRDRF